jgi:hypothetical protein
MIAHNSGEIAFDSGWRIQPVLSREDFLRSELARGATALPATGMEVSFSLERQTLHGTAVCVWLHFRGAELRGVTLILVGVETPPRGVTSPIWPQPMMTGWKLFSANLRTSTRGER